MTDLKSDAAGTLHATARKRLDTMRAHITRADAARSDTAHQARAARSSPPRPPPPNRIAAEAWTAVATHAATQAIDCRRGAELADRTRHRWAR